MLFINERHNILYIQLLNNNVIPSATLRRRPMECCYYMYIPTGLKYGIHSGFQYNQRVRDFDRGHVHAF